jgi:hypothetical protein
MNMHIEEIIEEFNQQINEQEEPIVVLGHEFKPSDVLNSLALSAYLKELDRYIEDNYKTCVSGDDGDITYFKES